MTNLVLLCSSAVIFTIILSKGGKRLCIVDNTLAMPGSVSVITDVRGAPVKNYRVVQDYNVR